jgi:periplasmic divalent cation tolerance protein
MRCMTALLVQITAPAEAAARISRALVEARVAACVNVLPGVRSVYRWQGQIEETEECLLIAKTAADCFEALRAEVLRLHPYELPEVLAVPVSAAHPPYLQWLLQESSP